MEYLLSQLFRVMIHLWSQYYNIRPLGEEKTISQDKMVFFFLNQVILYIKKKNRHKFPFLLQSNQAYWHVTS